MSERDWRKAGARIPDPGTVVSVHDTGGVFCGNDCRPFVPQSLRLKLQAAKARRRRAKAKREAAKNAKHR
jgi:hypothetical protein